MERQLSEDLAVESQEEKDYKFEFFELLDEVSMKNLLYSNTQWAKNEKKYAIHCVHE